MSSEYRVSDVSLSTLSNQTRFEADNLEQEIEKHFIDEAA
jgi:hypothetical protein